MKLLPVWGPRLCDESRFVEHFHAGGNHQHVDHAITSSCSLVLKARCQVVSLSRLGQTRCRGHDVQDVREAFEPCGAHEHREKRHKHCDDTVGSVRCGHEDHRNAHDGVAVQPYFFLRAHRKTRSSTTSKRAPTQEPSKQRVSQIGATWRVTTSEKLILTKSLRDA